METEKENSLFCPMCGHTQQLGILQCGHCGEDLNIAGRRARDRLEKAVIRESRALGGYWMVMGIASLIVVFQILSSRDRLANELDEHHRGVGTGVAAGQRSQFSVLWS